MAQLTLEQLNVPWADIMREWSSRGERCEFSKMELKTVFVQLDEQASAGQSPGFGNLENQELVGKFSQGQKGLIVQYLLAARADAGV